MQSYALLSVFSTRHLHPQSLVFVDGLMVRITGLHSDYYTQQENADLESEPRDGPKMTRDKVQRSLAAWLWPLFSRIRQPMLPPCANTIDTRITCIQTGYLRALRVLL
jgi:hypothetical protein